MISIEHLDLPPIDEDDKPETPTWVRLPWVTLTLSFLGTFAAGTVLGGMAFSSILLVVYVFGWTMSERTWTIAVTIGLLFWVFQSIRLFRKILPVLLASTAKNKRDDRVSKIVQISDVVKAIDVYGLEDFGPGFFLETRQGERVYVAGERVGDSVVDELELAEKITLQLTSSDEIRSMEIDGDPVDVSVGGVSVGDVLEETYISFKVLTDADGIRLKNAMDKWNGRAGTTTGQTRKRRRNDT